MIPISALRFTDEDERNVLNVLRSGNIAQGPRVAELEDAFARGYQAKHAIAMNNGTTALVAALRAHEIGAGDEVITSPFTFAATLNAILEVGATPIFADVSDVDFNLVPSNVEALITTRTRALMPVHLYGQMADMTSLNELAKRHSLVIVQDAAQSQGASHRGRAAGSEHTATFSLYATKNMTSGEGGIVTTDNDEVADRLRLLRNQGMRARYEYVIPGLNWRMTDLQAALCLPQLARYDEMVAQRDRNAQMYSAAFTDIEGMVTPSVSSENRHVWHQYTLRITDSAPVSRDEFIEGMSARGVATGVYYPRAVYDYDAFRNHPLVRSQVCETAERLGRQVVSIPVHQHLTELETEQITDAVLDVLGASHG